MNHKMNKKRTAKVVLATFGLSVLMPTAAFAATDIQGHWAGAVLEKWENQALIAGYEDGTIRPDNEISRAEFVALVNRVAGYQATDVAVAFTDVNANDWYAAQVAAAVQNGYIGGYEDNTFRPGNSVTRAEAASIIARIKNLSGNADRADAFADAASIPTWAKAVVGAVAEAGYMIGDENGNFNANKPLTRAEAVAALDRIFDVKEAASQTITLSTTEGVIYKGYTKTINVTTSVAGATIKAVSSDETVATVTVADGKVTIKGVGVGEATITVTVSAAGYKDATAAYQVTVKPAPAGGSSSVVSDSVVVVPAEDKIVIEGMEDMTPEEIAEILENLKIETVVYEAPVDATTGTADAVTKIELPEDVTVQSLTLPAGTPVTVTAPNGKTYSFKLTNKIEKFNELYAPKVRARALSNTNVQTIAVWEIDEATTGATDADTLEARAALAKLDPDRILITCVITELGDGDALLEWDIDGMTYDEEQEVIKQIEFALARI